MSSEIDPNMTIPQRFRIAQIIGLSFLGGLGMYALIVFLIRLPAEAPAPLPVEPALRIAVWVFGLASMVAGPLLTDRLIPRPSSPTDHDVAAMLVTRAIVRLAFIDAAAVGGLFIFFIAHDWTDFAALTGLAAALTLAKLPTRAEWLNEARATGLSWPL